MTTPTDRDQATRERLAEVLTEPLALWLEARGEPIRHTEAARHWLPVAYAFIDRELLPVVADLVREGQAEALRNAATSAPVVYFDNGYPVRAVPVSDLLSFAAGLRAPHPGATA